MATSTPPLLFNARPVNMRENRGQRRDLNRVARVKNYGLRLLWIQKKKRKKCQGSEVRNICFSLLLPMNKAEDFLRRNKEFPRKRTLGDRHTPPVAL